MEESVDSHLVGGVKDARHVAAATNRLVGVRQVAEALSVGRLESQRRELGKVEPRRVATQSARVSQRIGDRQMHVGRPQLSHHGTVSKLHHGMNNRLRMHHDLNPLGRQAKQPSRLDHLESFIHHRRRINRHLGAHRPIRVAQRLGRRDVGQCLARRRAKRSAGRRQQQFLHRLRILPDQALENGRMLRIDRQNRCPRTSSRRRDQFAGHD